MPEETPNEETPAMDEGMKAMYDAFMKRMDSLEAMITGKEVDEDPEAAPTEAAPISEEGQPAADATVEERLAVLEAAMAKMMGSGSEDADPEAAPAEKSEDMCKDAETIARAEILAPGIVKTADVKTKALDKAYATEEGKAVIDTLLGGKPYKTADKDLLFVGASELLKGARRSTLNNTRVSLDSLPGMKDGEMTPEKLNQMNAARYGTK